MKLEENGSEGAEGAAATVLPPCSHTEEAVGTVEENSLAGDLATGQPSDVPTAAPDPSRVSEDAPPPMHPLHASPNMLPSNRTSTPQLGTTNGGSEVELARRLGVRFDSSNAAWVARWVEPHSEKKKSRWFSVAKYGELSARRLAIQACLQNMKPSDFPSLRDLQDVLASFAANPPIATASGAVAGGSGPRAAFATHGLVSAAELGAGSNVARVDGMGSYGAKMAAQYMHPQFLHQGHQFAALHGVPPMANYMAAVAAGAMPPTMLGMASPSQMGMFCQGVPQHQAAPGFCLPTSETSRADDTESTKTEEEEGTVPPSASLNDANWANCSMVLGSAAEQQQQQQQPESLCCKPMYDQTTAGSGTGAAVKLETSSSTAPETNGVESATVTSVFQTPDMQHAAAIGASAAQQTAMPEGLEGTDLQSGKPYHPHHHLQGMPTSVLPPTEAPESYGMPAVGSPSRVSSSGLETRSGESDDDDDNDDFDEAYQPGKGGGSDSEGTGEEGKCKKRKLDASGTAVSGHALMGQQGAASSMAQFGMFGGGALTNAPSLHSPYYQLYPSFGQQGGAGINSFPFLTAGPYQLPLMPHHLHPHHAAAAAAAGFLPHLQPMDMTGGGLYLPPGAHYQQQQMAGVGMPTGDSPQSQTTSGSPTSGASPGVDTGAGFGGAGQHGGYKRLAPGGCHHGASSAASSGSSGGASQGMSAKMTCERGLHYSRCYRGNQECWIAVWNTKGGRIMHEAFDVAALGFEQAKSKAREARDAAHSNNVAVAENSRPSWKSHSNTGIPHVSLDSQQLRFRAHKFGRRLCRSFSFGRRRGSFASRESAFDAAVLWLIQTPTEEEIAAVSGVSSKMEDPL